jgi:hypothetical protein
MQELRHMPTTNIITIPYHGQRIEALRRGGRILLRVGNILPTLGVPERTIRFIFKRDANLFVEGVDFDFIEEMTPGGMQRVKVVTLSGLRILALRANTPAAREFQRFVAGMIRGEVRFREAPQPSLPMPGTHRLSRVEGRLLEAIEAVAEDPAELQALISDLRSGARVLEPDPHLAEIAAAHRMARAAVSQSHAALKAVERQAALAEYTMDQVRQASLAIADAEG